MEVEEIQSQPCKFSRVGNGRNDSTKSAQKLTDHSYQEDDDDDQKKPNLSSTSPCASNKVRGWHHSSRIIRVSRASGGKDRHSKVWTSKGPRDRRVRLSVTTAIQFYDLQDRLGYDQPSKAVEWLIKAAADSIAELPSLNSSFPSTPRQLSDEKEGSDVGNEQGFDSADLELESPGFNHQNQNQQHLSLSKSTCSSTSEISKGSGLSLSRSDMLVNRVKARERARERAAKEREKENESRIGQQQHQTLHPISQSSTFTELLTAGIGSVSNNSNSNNNNANTNAASSCSQPNFFQKRQWPSTTPMDYLNGFLGATSSRTTHQSSSYSGQFQMGHSIPQNMTMTMSIPPFNAAAENHNQHQQEQQQLHNFPFVSDHFMSLATTAQPVPTGDYNLNFTISPGLAGFNRGTLQSNSTPSPSLLPHLQRFTSFPIDGSNVNVPLFIGAAPAVPLENHQHHHQFPPGLQLCYSDGSRQSDKGKGKN